MKKYAFGVDIGGTTVKIGFFESCGELKEVWEIPTRTQDHGKNILPDIQKAILNKLDENNISLDEVEGVGMGIPGPVGEDGTVFTCVNLGWSQFNVEQEMSALLNCKVKAGNDANVAALGEMWQGGGKGYKNIVMVTLGTGVGGGIIIDGKILCGCNGAAGEIGHIPVRDDETDVCGCGKKGCLEQYTSANGLVRVTKRYLEAHDDESVLRQIDSFTTKDICKAASEGDAVANKMIDELGQTLGKATATIAAVVNPQAFIFGGGLANAGHQIMDPIQKYFVHYCFPAQKETQFKLATLGNSAGVYGAVKQVLD
ncbi:ROK family glucokinase [Floccifex sp.]|uniref:ROK family glucokinase n=1 Tax=Floccifex sp. TaxID=2815810 RepID=UPI002A752576|nr:ROK family glucokinase [Floccifex sp.]MDY2957564.1 ROK family glucokinase [Floccifex sp.]